jgi:hypothetical protein
MAIVLFVFIAVIMNGRMVHADGAGCSYLLVTPSVCVANASGEVFAINISVLNVQNLRAFEFKLGYNVTLLDAVKVVQGPFFPSPPNASVERLEINRTAGFVWMRVSLPGSEPTISGSGSLATITFNVIFAPAPSERACCALRLYDTLLYNESMATIAHDSADGLYFFRSIQDDPSTEGGLLDVSTQKGGIGQGVPGGTFTQGEMVELNVNLTYNGAPVAYKLVSFQVFNPENETTLGRVGFTNNEGLATINFTIPSIPGSLGTWTVVATADVSGETVWDFLTFKVIARPPIPVGGYSIPIENPTITRPLMPYLIVIVILAGAFTTARRKRHPSLEAQRRQQACAKSA